MEDDIPGRKVKTERFLDRMWFFSKFHAYYPNEQYNLWQKLHVVAVIVLVNIAPLVMFVVQVYYIRTMEQLLNNFPMNVSLISCFVKFGTFLKMRTRLVGVKNLFAELDCKQFTTAQIDFLEKKILFCQRVTLIISFAYSLVVTTTTVNAAKGHHLMYFVWTPYDCCQSAWVYWGTFLFQYFTFMWLALENLTNDLSGPLYFIMLKAHLQIVMERIECIGWSEEKTKEENYREFLNCIEDHRLIMKIFDVVESTLSFATFTQFASTAFTVAMELVIALFYPFSFTQIVMLLVSALASTLEILPCCYYSNNFMVQTDGIVTAIYSSNFYDQSKEFQKTAIIFMQMTQKAKVVFAGKVFPVTLATFASIMKTSYTLLTVASQLR